MTLTADWYGFEELLWDGDRGGRREQFRTAALFHVADDGAILHQIGIGTESSAA